MWRSIRLGWKSSFEQEGAAQFDEIANYAAGEIIRYGAGRVRGHDSSEDDVLKKVQILLAALPVIVTVGCAVAVAAGDDHVHTRHAGGDGPRQRRTGHRDRPLTENDAWAQSRQATAETQARGVAPPATPSQLQSQPAPLPMPQQQGQGPQPQPNAPQRESQPAQAERDKRAPQPDAARELRLGGHASGCSNSSQRGPGREASRSRHREKEADKRRKQNKGRGPALDTPQEAQGGLMGEAGAHDEEARRYHGNPHYERVEGRLEPVAHRDRRREDASGAGIASDKLPRWSGV